MYSERHAPGKTEQEQVEAAFAEWYEVIVKDTGTVVVPEVLGDRSAMAVADELTSNTGIKHVERIIHPKNNA